MSTDNVSLTGLAVGGGSIYTGLAIQALDAKSGAPVWSFGSGNTEFLTTPAVASGLVFAGSADDSLCAIRA